MIQTLLREKAIERKRGYRDLRPRQAPWYRWVLPQILTLATGKARHLPEVLDFNWKGNVTHSLLMCYYWLFWRLGDTKTGKDMIRNAGLIYAQRLSREGKTREVGIATKFGVLLYLEHEIIRKWNIGLKWEWVQVPILVPAYAGFPAPEPKMKWVLFSIALDTTGSRQATSSTPTILSVTHAGSGRLSTTCFNWGSGTISSGPTFGGSNYTQISSTVNTSDGNPFIAGHQLVAPSTSGGNVTITMSGSTFYNFLLTSYTGTDQTTPTAVETNNTGAVSPASPVDYSRTSDKGGSWMWIIGKSDSGGAAVDISAGGSKRVGIGSPNITCMFDSNADVASGATQTMTLTHAGGGQHLGVVYCMIRAGAQSFNQTVTAVGAGIGAVAKVSSFVRALAAIGAGLAVMTKINNFKRTLAATGAGIGVVLKGLSKTLSSTGAGLAAMVAVRVYPVAMAAVGAGVAAISKAMTKVQALVATGAGAAAISMTKSFARTLAGVGAGVATLIARRTVIMHAIGVAVAVVRKVPRKVFAVVASVVARIRQDFWKTKYTPQSDTYSTKFPSETGGGSDYDIKYPHGE